MTTKKPALGRGLGALLGEATARQVTANAAAIAASRTPAGPAMPGAAPVAVEGVAPAPAQGTAAPPPADELARLPVDLLQRGKYQPRIDMRPESLQELADSIRAQGIVQPIVVRPLEHTADAVGRSRAAVSNLLRLLDLADEVKSLVEKRELEMGHARALLGLSSRRQQAEVGALVAKKGLSVRETEALVRRMVSKAAGGAADDDGRAGGDANIRKLESDLSEKLGARVTVKHQSSGKGQLIVTYSSLDELDGILAHIQ